MSITSISTALTEHATPPHQALKHFAFEKWAWVALATILSSASAAFGNVLDNPFQARECPLLGNNEPLTSTPIWTNQIGQYTLSNQDSQGSYQSYAKAFEGPLSEWIQGMNKLASRSSHAAERALGNSLTTSTHGYIPQELKLDGALRSSNKLFDYSSEAISQDLSTLSKKALNILRSWHPNDEINIHTLKLVDASLGDNSRNLTLHVDGVHHAGLTVPASEYPLVKNEIWITKNGEKARLESIDETTGEIEVTLLENFDSVSGKSAVLKDSDLDYHTCVSEKTTQIVPGLVFNPSPNGVFDQRNLVQPNSSMRKHAYKILKYAVQIPYKSSLLFLGDQVVHSVPPYPSEPNSESLKNCSKLFRKRLSVFYEINGKTSRHSALGESSYRLLIFFSKHAGPLINAACILVSLFAVRLLTMPVP